MNPEIDDVERRQLMLARSLKYVLGVGIEERLPTLNWVVVADGLALYGYPNPDSGPDERDKAFRLWCEAMEEEFHPHGQHAADRATWRTTLPGGPVEIVVKNADVGA